MLNCENPKNDDRALDAFQACHEADPDAAVVFEHGQLWITNNRTGAQWSVNDASGPGSCDGFSFEQVSNGDNE